MAKIKVPGGWLVGAIPEGYKLGEPAPAAAPAEAGAEEAPKKPRTRGKQ